MISRFYQLWTLGQFNKFLNSIPLPKPTNRFGQLRNLAKRIQNAHDDLLFRTNHKVEGLYHLNKKGKASEFATDNLPNQVTHLAYRPKAPTITIHNHPRNSALSGSDHLAIHSPKHQHIAVDRYGSRYRTYAKDPYKQKALHYIVGNTEDLDKVVVRNLKDISYDDNTLLAYSHGKNKALKRLGLIHYSAKIKNPAYKNPKVQQETKRLEDYYYNKYKNLYDKYQKENPMS